MNNRKREKAACKKLGINVDAWSCASPEPRPMCPRDLPLPMCPDDEEEGEYSCPWYEPDYLTGDMFVVAIKKRLIEMGVSFVIAYDKHWDGSCNEWRVSCLNPRDKFWQEEIADTEHDAWLLAIEAMPERKDAQKEVGK